jgi:hypothetical protein
MEKKERISSSTIMSSSSSSSLSIRTQSGKKRKRRQKLCNEYKRTGTCKFSDTCKFAHGEVELKMKFRKPVLSEERKSIREEAKKRSDEKKDVASFECAGFSSMYGDFVTRYFQELFYVPEGDVKKEDQYVNVHRNELCVVGIAPGHPILQQGLKIKSICFKHDLKGLSGKKKKGSPTLAPDSTFCTITCEDESEWRIRSGVQGNLWEINNRVLSDPTLVSKYSRTDGYLGIIMPKNPKMLMSTSHNRPASLLTRTEYKILRERRGRDGGL